MFNLIYLCMVKNIFKYLAFVAIMAFASCTNEDLGSLSDNNLSLGKGENVVRISLSNTMTRTARPIGSSENTNNINRLVFRIFDVDKEEVENFTIDGIEDEDGNDLILDGYYICNDNVIELPSSYEDNKIINIKFIGLQKGTYKIIVYGYNYTEEIDETPDFPYTAVNQIPGTYMLSCEGVLDVQEIFAGTHDNLVSVNQHGKFTKPVSIILNRQVAGLMAYLCDVPVSVRNSRVAKITISSRADVTGFCFPASLHSTPEYNGYSSGGWYTDDEWVDYLTFDIKSNASNYNDTHLLPGDTYEFDSNEGQFLLANETGKIDGLVCKEGTLFGSCFLLAYPSYIEFDKGGLQCATLNICYWDDLGNLILSVPLRKGGDAEDELGDSSYQYGILCNNFYSIGQKSNVDDEGIPISIDESTGYESIGVEINSNWIENTLVNK